MNDVNNFYYKILTQSLKAPGARVNRADFLAKNLRKYCLTEQVDKAISNSVLNAEIPEDVLEKLANSVIKEHTLKVTGISTLTGMPGGLAMAATIPADLAQYYFHVIVLAQKLAYIYGYPQFANSEDVEDELFYHLTLFIGVMYKVEGAKNAVLSVSENLGAQAVLQVPETTFNETAFYILRKNIARWVGLKITKKTFAQSITKAIPVVSGLISGGVSYFSFTPQIFRN